MKILECVLTGFCAQLLLTAAWAVAIAADGCAGVNSDIVVVAGPVAACIDVVEAREALTLVEFTAVEVAFAGFLATSSST